MNTQRTRTTTLALAIGVALAAAPAAAHADTYCVKGGCASAADKTFPSLYMAINEAAKDTKRDRIEIGPYTFAGTSVTVANDNPVDIVGAGRDATTLIGSPDAKAPVITLQDPTSNVSSLSVKMGSGASDNGITVNGGKVSDVQVTDAAQGTATTSGSGVSMAAARQLLNSRVVMSGKLTAVTATSQPGPFTVVQGSELSGNIGLKAYGSGSVQARKLRVLDSGTGVQSLTTAGGKLRIVNSLVEVSRGLNPVGLSAYSDAAVANPRLEAHGVTAVTSSPGSYGIASTSNGGETTVKMDNSVLYGFERSLVRDAQKGKANLEVRYSAFNDANMTSLGDGDLKFSNYLTGDPGFVNAATKDFRLQPSSRLVDAGTDNASDFFDDTTDLVAQPRFADGNGDGVKGVDMGAYELQFTPPAPQPQTNPVQPQGGGGGVGPVIAQQTARDTVAPAVSGFRLSRRAVRRGSKSKVTARFSLSEAATVRVSVERQTGRGRKARTVTVGALQRALKKGANTMALTGKLRPAGLKPGTYRLAITARDAAGNRSAVRRVTFRVTSKR